MVLFLFFISFCCFFSWYSLSHMAIWLYGHKAILWTNGHIGKKWLRKQPRWVFTDKATHMWQSSGKCIKIWLICEKQEPKYDSYQSVTFFHSRKYVLVFKLPLPSAIKQPLLSNSLTLSQFSSSISIQSQEKFVIDQFRKIHQQYND